MNDGLPADGCDAVGELGYETLWVGARQRIPGQKRMFCEEPGPVGRRQQGNFHRRNWGGERTIRSNLLRQ